jgi:hypothetical protein
MVRLAHFHLASRDIPYPRVQIDFFPFRMAKLAGANENVGRELQCQLCQALALIAINGAQQFAHALGIGDRAVVCDGGGSQCTAQIAGRIGAQAGGGHGVAKHHACQLQGAPCALQIALGFNLANRHQHVRRLYLGNRKPPDAAIQQR